MLTWGQKLHLRINVHFVPIKRNMPGLGILILMILFRRQLCLRHPPVLLAKLRSQAFWELGVMAPGDPLLQFLSSGPICCIHYIRGCKSCESHPCLKSLCSKWHPRSQPWIGFCWNTTRSVSFGDQLLILLKFLPWDKIQWLGCPVSMDAERVQQDEKRDM